MISPRAMLALGTALAAVGIWWLLPGSGTARRTFGGILALAGFGCLASFVPVVGDWFTTGVFHVIAAVTIIAAVATISFRSPVYCAIWFGMTLTGVAGLFLLAGAEFLAVATLVVYAGAILVTFLFVLMLSEPEGHTSYDRRSWEPMISSFIGAVLVGILTAMISSTITSAKELSTSVAAEEPITVNSHPGPLPQGAGDALSTSSQATGVGSGVAPYKVSRLGADLFTRYLIAVEAAGVLLFAALVGAAVIVTQGRAAMKRPPMTGKGATTHAF
jgi:NADH-quinone oxidoreductase subunit J